VATPRLEIGVGLGTQPPIGRVRGLAWLGRLLRADSLWAVDHFLGLFPTSIWDRDFTWVAGPGTTPHAFFDYQTLLGYMARRVGSARLAVGVTEPIRRHPVLIAQAAMTLAHLTRRAPILGLGAGERENIEPYGLDFRRPVDVFEEAIQVIKLCLESRGAVSFQGDHFQLRDAVLDLSPPPDRIPSIWVAAHGDRMLRLTGRYGDGWYPTFPMSPSVYAEKLAVVRRAADAAGRDPSSIVPALQAFIVVGRSEAAARELLGSRPVRYSSLLVSDEVWQRHGLTHPLGEGFRGMIDLVPPRLSRAELEEAMRSVPVDLLAEEAVWGTPDQVVTKVRALAQAGLRHIVLVPLSAMVSRRDAAFTIRALFGISRRLRSGAPRLRSESAE
jgi:phthiodiolone/phenolphthiodiolone dimycocerosates ketoreductase